MKSSFYFLLSVSFLAACGSGSGGSNGGNANGKTDVKGVDGFCSREFVSEADSISDEGTKILNKIDDQSPKNYEEAQVLISEIKHVKFNCLKVTQKWSGSCQDKNKALTYNVSNESCSVFDKEIEKLEKQFTKTDYPAEPTPMPVDPSPAPKPEAVEEDLAVHISIRSVNIPKGSCEANSNNSNASVLFEITFDNKVVTGPVKYKLILSEKSGEAIPNVKFVIPGLPIENGIIDLSGYRSGGLSGHGYIRAEEYCNMRSRPEKVESFSISLVRVQ